MKYILAIVFSYSVILNSLIAEDIAKNFPTKPIKIIVYTAPGGLIDITARKLATAMENTGLNVPVVVENKKGAGGLVALSYLERMPKDGHTLFAFTNSVISKAIFSKKEKFLKNLDYLKLLALDYECLIAKKDFNTSNFIKNPSKFIIAGPSIGGTDYMFVKKIWNHFKTKGKFIPYKSGSEAIASVLGGHADIYVGNPQDIKGRDNLKIIAIASKEKLKSYPNVKTFSELGIDIQDEFLWRGIAVHKDIKDEIKIKILEIINSAIKDTDWLDFIEKSGVIKSDLNPEEFENEVTNEIIKLKKLNEN